MAQGTCGHEGCNKSLEGMKSNAKFCSNSCRAKYSAQGSAIKKLMGLPAQTPATEQKLSYPMQSNNNGTGAEIFLLQQRITELMEEKRGLNTDIKVLHDKVDKLKDEVNAKDKELIQNQKAEGLAGVSDSLLQSFISTLPSIMSEGGKLISPNGGGSSNSILTGLDIKAQQKVTAFAAMIGALDEAQADHFFTILQMAELGQADQAKQLIINYNQTYGTNKASNG